MLFAKKTKKYDATGVLPQLIENLRGVVNDNQISNKIVARSALSMESLREEESHSLDSALNGLTASLEHIAQEAGIAKILTRAQRDAAVCAGIITGDIPAFLAAPVNHQIPAMEGMSVVSLNSGDSFTTRSVGLEAYDERDNRNSNIYSVAYNMQAARQNDFGEAFFPTVVVTPDQVGFQVSIRLIQIYNDFKRAVSGELAKYEKKNILRAVVDHTILKTEMTKVIPVARPEAAASFVPVADIPVRSILNEGEPINTAPLATGKRVDLIGLSQTDTLLSAGVMDTTDSLDTAITLSNVYAKVGVDIIKFSTENLPLAVFTAAPQGNYRTMMLSFNTTSLLMNKNSTNVDGSALTTLADIKVGDYVVRLELNVTGNVNIETGETIIYGNGFDVFSVQNAAGELLDMTVAPALDIVNDFAGAKVIGYDLKAYRTNLNRRQRGQLLDTTYFTQAYNVQLRGPISTMRPVTADGQTDAADLGALVTATHIQISNTAVTTLLNAANSLAEYVDARDPLGVGPDVLGIARYLIKPVYHSQTIDLLTAIDSLKSQERSADIQAVLIMALRDAVYRMYRDSNFKAASDAMNGGTSKPPTVIIGTDPVIARYLMVSGDLRTLGSDFECKVVTTLDARMIGKIAVSFGNFDGQNAGQPDPMHFGNMAWKPELTLVLPIARNNQISKELTVQPAFLHIVHLPILAMFEVTGLPETANSKTPLYFHTV